ncbi:MAG TPA: ABC transporter permease [Candidatus Onthocola gallistercoris]|uniref:ABC transporter permease n=1 Tax=Candidatus Onthocola gallistercoris TaxID=2840876 RepID=A0A9D1HKE6_9FIRM|nr:ABC transporter permease [Candidatus Onthocola gallistercoris]
MDRQKAFLNDHRRHRRFIRFFQILIAIAFFGLWEVTTRVHVLDAFIFSSPSRILTTFSEMARDGTIFYHIGITLFETLLSFIIVLILGTAISVLLWWNRKAAVISEPYLIVLNSLPKTALAPILIVWLGNNMKTIIVCAVSLAIFSTIINLYTSFTEMDADKLLLIRTLGGGKKEILSKVILPGSIPTLISNMKVNIGLCLVGVIIGEFLAANAGIGYLIIYGSQVFKLSWVIMSIVLLCIIAMGLYALIGAIEKLYRKQL